ncbi:hypothetical protein RND81_07G065600 [Saponaria officinalis]|uniref:Ubiquitin-like protease family profile domain-containing protein n=1 Tax=Saponaria officinalis TaxID=3572 RepID=A0AAW1JKW4_SAPOF
MRILETYKGVKKNYSIGLQDDHQVKRFSFRACHYILSCNENNLKVKVEEDSRSLITSSTQTDIDLVNYVCKGRTELNEILIDTEWMQVTRGALRTLKRRAWVMDMVIDMFGVMCTVNATGFFYLPTTVKVFFPICHGDHWLACVIDVQKKKKFILDSNTPKKSHNLFIDRNELISKIVQNVEKAIMRPYCYTSLMGMSLFESVHLDVPQQKNGYDCGVFLLKWLAVGNNETLSKSEDYYNNLDDYRQTIMLQLLKWDKNKLKVFS